MSRLKLREVGRFPEEWRIPIDNLQTEALRKVATSFLHNMMRSGTLAYLPLALAATVARNTYADVHATKSVADRLFTPTDDRPALRDVPEYWHHKSVFLKEHAEAVLPNDEEHFEFLDRLTDLPAIEQDGKVNATLAFEALLSGHVLASWTAFECLASDLWVAALNSCPSPLGEKALLAPEYDKDRPEVLTSSEVAAEGDAQKPKFVKIDVLRRHGFDLSHSMGDILRRKFPLDRLAGMRHAYGVVFGASAKAIFKKHQRLSALEAIRNLIVHRGGQVDQQFLDRVQSDPNLSSTTPGSTLLVDGELSGQLMRTAAEAGSELLCFVDNWFVEHNGAALKQLDGDDAGEGEREQGRPREWHAAEPRTPRD